MCWYTEEFIKFILSVYVISFCTQAYMYACVKLTPGHFTGSFSRVNRIEAIFFPNMINYLGFEAYLSLPYLITFHSCWFLLFSFFLFLSKFRKILKEFLGSHFHTLHDQDGDFAVYGCTVRTRRAYACVHTISPSPAVAATWSYC